MTTAMKIPTEAQVVKFLKSLGKTPDAIAKTLEKRHVKGICQNPYKCAIAQALVDEFGGNTKYRWSVSSEIELEEYTLQQTSYSGGKRVRKRSARLLSIFHSKVPQAIGDFIAAYDHHAYPKLETAASLKVPVDEED